MGLTPLDIRKMAFPHKLRGFDPTEVEEFLGLVSEELTARLGDIARLEEENRSNRQRLDEAGKRQQDLQEALLHAQRLSKDITDNAKKEASILIKEAEVAAEGIVTQAIEQATKIETKIAELRYMRRDLQLKFRNTLDLFQRILEAEMDEERTTATIRTLPRQRRQSS